LYTVHIHKHCCTRRCRALKPAGRPLPHCRGGNGPPSATRRLRGGGAVVDSKNIVYHVNSSACYVYVTFFYSTTSISFYKSFYTLRVFIYFLQLHFRGHFRTAKSLFYVYTHLRLYSTPTLICGCTAVSTVPDVCRRLYSTPTLICGCTAVSPVPDVWRCLYSTPTLICGRTAVIIVPDVCRRPSSTPTFICGCITISTYVFGCLISTFYISYLLLHSTFICGCTAVSTYVFGCLISTYIHRGPSLALFSRWQRVHGYTSLIRPRLQSSLHSLHSTPTS
jgi:hypothetical protein